MNRWGLGISLLIVIIAIGIWISYKSPAALYEEMKGDNLSSKPVVTFQCSSDLEWQVESVEMIRLVQDITQAVDVLECPRFSLLYKKAVVFSTGNCEYNSPAVDKSKWSDAYALQLISTGVTLNGPKKQQAQQCLIDHQADMSKLVFFTDTTFGQINFAFKNPAAHKSYGGMLWPSWH